MNTLWMSKTTIIIPVKKKVLGKDNQNITGGQTSHMYIFVWNGTITKH